MNRQQRREQMKRISRERAFEQRYAQQIEERQAKIDDRLIEVYMVCIGLALNKLYGWDDERINAVIEEFNRQICRIDGVNVTYDTLMAELNRETGIEFRWVEDPAYVDVR